MIKTLQHNYTESARVKVMSELGIKNKHAAPRLVKLTINVGQGDVKGNEALQKSITEGLSLITGQKPIQTRAKKAIAGFKIRENDLMGYKITLRGKRMRDLLERLITYVFPRLRDFQGMSLKGFDTQGNYSFGFRDVSAFPEVPYQTAGQTWGMQVTITTDARDKNEAEQLLRALGFPFEKPKQDK